MNVFLLLTLTASFLNLIHNSSSEECSTSTECLSPATVVQTTIEIGIIYDLYEDTSANQAVIDLDAIVGQVLKEFGDCLSFKRYPGASVQSSDQGITCNDDCFRNQEDACKGVVDSGYFTQQEPPEIDIEALQSCVDNSESDDILTTNGGIRCTQGITKLPALLFNQAYDPCSDFTSADQLKTFLCTNYAESLAGKCG